MGVEEAIFFSLRLASHYGVLHCHAVGHVLDCDAVEYLDFFAIELAFVQNAGIGYEVLELRNFHFEHALSFFGGIVFGILA